MRREADKIVVFITTGSEEEGHKIAELLVNQRKAACVNIVPRVDSMFWWEGKLDSGRESLLIVKTKASLFPEIVDLVKRAHDSNKVIGAICHGPQLLISADIVKGRKVTSWASVAVDLRNAGAEWVDEPVVQDRNIITSRKPSDIPKFNKAVIETLKDRYGATS